MRAPFNRQVNLYWGPATATPGAIRVPALLCRIVPDLVFLDLTGPFEESLSYLTSKDAVPFGPQVTPVLPGVYEFDFEFADRVSLTVTAEPTHYVQRVELRTRGTEEIYWRSYLAPLTPPLTPCQEGYSNLYQFEPIVPGWYDLNRIGPTTWIYGDWTLQAEVGGTIIPECVSNWELTSPEGKKYYASWDGNAEYAFTSGFPDYSEIYVRRA